MYIEECTNLEELRPLAEQWLSEADPGRFGLEVDPEIVKSDMEKWLSGEGIIFVAKQDDTILGMISVFTVPSYLGNQKIALEKYWYCTKGCHFAGPRLYMEAIGWARDHGCSHMITSGSRMASDRHDSICAFLEATGAKHFETSYIYALNGEV